MKNCSTGNSLDSTVLYQGLFLSYFFSCGEDGQKGAIESERRSEGSETFKLAGRKECSRDEVQSGLFKCASSKPKCWNSSVAADMQKKKRSGLVLTAMIKEQ